LQNRRPCRRFHCAMVGLGFQLLVQRPRHFPVDATLFHLVEGRVVADLEMVLFSVLSDARREVVRIGASAIVLPSPLSVDSAKAQGLAGSPLLLKPILVSIRSILDHATELSGAGDVAGFRHASVPSVT